MYSYDKKYESVYLNFFRQIKIFLTKFLRINFLLYLSYSFT
jgi:hypothetical protein